ncbi:TetR/AcrR family transcriptional regulator [Candidatus Viadribacter manganicus]|uniref:TetR family transcriptional regulator n=1 Tax=Candidatus Viadribacter manganicus TaxID=1759059 RepID=A0A1B1AGE9_9PROT|nr:TetR/AcrR family transcriptional regulator [Candidatus Viadribacter manganicus]ANP45627.1 TetR family transcriptional regulator [Candidatus Viadribacter manganicus]
MARTQAADYDERKLAIVEQAAALFASRGFNGASVADIAERCKTSKSLIYHYYESKEDILFDVMISHVRALEAAAADALAANAGAEQKLRDLTQLFMALYVGAADRHKVLLNDLGYVPKARRAEIVAVQRGLIESVRKLLVEIEPALKRRDGASFSAAMLFFGAINWTHTWYDPKGAMTPEALADMAADLTLGGLARAARA